MVGLKIRLANARQTPKYDTIRDTYIGLWSEVPNKIVMKCDKVGKCPTYFPLEPFCRKVVYGPGENGPLRSRVCGFQLLTCASVPSYRVWLTQALLVETSWNGCSRNLTAQCSSFVPISREISPSPLCMLRQTERRTRGRNPSLSLSCKHALSVCCRTFLRRRRGGVRSNVWRRDSNCSRQYLQPFIFHF